MKNNKLASPHANATDLHLNASAADTYTKTQINTLLGTTADASEVYPTLVWQGNASHTYTQTPTND